MRRAKGEATRPDALSLAPAFACPDGLSRSLRLVHSDRPSPDIPLRSAWGQVSPRSGTPLARFSTARAQILSCSRVLLEPCAHGGMAGRQDLAGATPVSKCARSSRHTRPARNRVPAVFNHAADQPLRSLCEERSSAPMKSSSVVFL